MRMSDLLSTYRGLKLHQSLNAVIIADGLLSAYRGLKRVLQLLSVSQVQSLLSAYGGLKRKACGFHTREQSRFIKCL